MLKIVLLDDERIVLRGISALIKREENYELSGTAENGIDGLELIKNTRPDIVMTDIRMPGMNGLDTQSLRVCAGKYLYCIQWI